MDIEQYRHLWDGSEPNWVLIREPPSPESEPDASFEIFNLKTYMMFVVEDQELANALSTRMLQEGVRVLDSIPEGGPYG